MENTLESIVQEILRREKNSLEIIQNLQTLSTTNSDSVILNYELQDGTVNKIEIKSFNYMIQEIKRLSNNVNNISGIGLSKAYIKDENGNIKYIVNTVGSVELPTVPNLIMPKTFSTRNNNIFDKFLTPQLYTTFLIPNFDVANSVLCRKVVCDIVSSDDLFHFESKIKGVNNLDFDDTTNSLLDAGISFSEFDTIYQTRPDIPQISGKFTVLNKFNKTSSIIVDGIVTPIKKIIYKLDKPTYINTADNTEVSIKVGDLFIESKSGKFDTVYEVLSVDLSTSEVEFKRNYGATDIRITVDSLAIYPKKNTSMSIDVDIVPNQYAIYWFKPINSNGSVINLSWGSGIGVYTNEFINSNDNTSNLLDFYNTNITDIGKSLETFAKDNNISHVDGVKPDAPILDVSNFRVEIINQHLNSFSDDKVLKSKTYQKDQLKSNITALDASIKLQKEKLATTKFVNSQDYTKENEKLLKMQSDRDSLSTQYDSIVSEIANLNKNAADFVAKYRTRGFWGVPAPKYKDSLNKIGKQEVVQFIIEYRYLKKDNTSSEISEFNFKSNTGADIKGVISKWERVYSKLRNKTVDASGNSIWDNEDTLNPDVVNFNQLQIPIASGENLEIRIKSISEAGYPKNQIESDWSSSVIIEFPEDKFAKTKSSTNDITIEQAVSSIKKELTSIGLPEHLAEQIRTQKSFFSHSAKSIFTSTKTPENEPKSVEDEILDMKNTISKLTSIINGENPTMKISIVDEFGNFVADVNKNDTIKIFGGYYSDIVKDIVVKKGEIVSKLYYIEISDLSQIDLELLSYVPGSYKDIIPKMGSSTNNTADDYTGYLIDTREYKEYRKYWKAPISLRATRTDVDLIGLYTTIGSPKINKVGIQSGQSKGQVIYSRYKDVTLSNELYIDGNGTVDDILLPNGTSGTPTSYVWNLTKTTATTPNGNGFLSDFCVHTDHPDIQLGSDFMNEFEVRFSSNGFINQNPYNADKTEIFYPQFYHSKSFNIPSGSDDYLKQLSMFSYDTVPQSDVVGVSNLQRKFGFYKNDKYLIGKYTCGAYLFLAPNDHSSIAIDSPIYNSTKIVKNSANLRIPFIFSCRATDYNGAGSSGIGNIGGDSNQLSNITYTKKIGVDIPVKNQGLFSFDIEVSMSYKPTSIN